jgi:hypothetical protein
MAVEWVPGLVALALKPTGLLRATFLEKTCVIAEELKQRM